jgi:hypothetical protein
MWSQSLDMDVLYPRKCSGGPDDSPEGCIPPLRLALPARDGAAILPSLRYGEWERGWHHLYQIPAPYCWAPNRFTALSHHPQALRASAWAPLQAPA